MSDADHARVVGKTAALSLTAAALGLALASCLAGCSKDNPVAGHLQAEPCEMTPCPAGSYCPQQCR